MKSQMELGSVIMLRMAIGTGVLVRLVPEYWYANC
jgi:hypothetical protein